MTTLFWTLLVALSLLSLELVRADQGQLERIELSADGRGLVQMPSGHVFHPWGVNYGNAGRLMEDFWEADWQTLQSDFRKLAEMGANVVRVHLQLGKFMISATQPNAEALERLARLISLAERNRLYLDITGLACYRKADTPLWYDALSEADRWAAQTVFWNAVAAKGAVSPAVFCYDLMNEPLSPGDRRAPGQWYSGKTMGGYDFLQFISLNPEGRSREEVVHQWITHMKAAIRKKDGAHLVTVGLLPWSRDWHDLSGFVPAKVAPDLDFICLHLYPDSKKPGEALEALKHGKAGKPVVIEETFPLSCSAAEFAEFMQASRRGATGWIGHYDGRSLKELDAEEKVKPLSLHDMLYREWLRLMVERRREFVGE